MTRAAVACGPDPERHSEAIGKYVDAGFAEVYVAQVGPDQESSLRFLEKEPAPRLGWSGVCAEGPVDKRTDMFGRAPAGRRAV